jgi:hypothetical protein
LQAKGGLSLALTQTKLDVIRIRLKPVEEKAVMQHHEHIDTAQHGHQEMTRPGSEEGMQ